MKNVEMWRCENSEGQSSIMNNVSLIIEG